MADLPIESANKYGRGVDDDLDSFADMLDGGDGSRRSGPDSVDVGPRNQTVDDDVLREALNNPRKYGG